MPRRSDRGAAAVEAGLLVAGVSAVLVTILSLTGEDVLAMFRSWIDAIGVHLPG
jgi:Flp pilus assembly pilin Flp